MENNSPLLSFPHQEEPDESLAHISPTQFSPENDISILKNQNNSEDSNFPPVISLSQLNSTNLLLGAEKKCLYCNETLFHLNFNDREKHINHCLDSYQLMISEIKIPQKSKKDSDFEYQKENSDPSSSSDDFKKKKKVCLYCKKNITNMSANNRRDHTEKCQSFKSNDQINKCPICFLELDGVKQDTIVRHIKNCQLKEKRQKNKKKQKQTEKQKKSKVQNSNFENISSDNQKQQSEYPEKTKKNDLNLLTSGFLPPRKPQNNQKDNYENEDNNIQRKVVVSIANTPQNEIKLTPHFGNSILEKKYTTPHNQQVARRQIANIIELTPPRRKGRGENETTFDENNRNIEMIQNGIYQNIQQDIENTQNKKSTQNKKKEKKEGNDQNISTQQNHVDSSKNYLLDQNNYYSENNISEEDPDSYPSNAELSQNFQTESTDSMTDNENDEILSHQQPKNPLQTKKYKIEAESKIIQCCKELETFNEIIEYKFEEIENNRKKQIQLIEDQYLREYGKLSKQKNEFYSQLAKKLSLNLNQVNLISKIIE